MAMVPSLDSFSKHGPSSEVQPAAVDPHTTILTLIATKYNRKDPLMKSATYNWRAEVPMEDWTGVVATPGRVNERIVLELNGNSPPLLKSLHLVDLGPSLLTTRLMVLKFNGEKVKGA